MAVNFQSDIANALTKGSYRATDDLPARADESPTLSLLLRGLPHSRRFTRRL